LNLVERDFKSIVSFKAFQRTVTHVQQLKQSNLIVSIGEDDEFLSPTIKIWNMDKLDKSDNPLLIRSIKIFGTKQKPFPVTCLAVLEDLSQMAVGLASGDVILLRGEITKERACRQFTLQVDKELPVTGVGFREGKKLTLFAVTSGSVVSFDTSSKDTPRVKTQLFSYSHFSFFLSILLLFYF